MIESGPKPPTTGDLIRAVYLVAREVNPREAAVISTGAFTTQRTSASIRGSPMTANFLRESSQSPSARRDPRIGVMITASDAVVERDFVRFLPRSMSFHVARLMQPVDVQPGTLSNMDGVIDYMPEAASTLKVVEPDLVLFCCTSASFYRGPNWNQELDSRISKDMGKPAISTSTALLQALGAMGVQRLLLVSPYPAHTNQLECDFLQAHGISVVGVHAFNCIYSREIADVGPERILNESAEYKASAPEADCLFISCTGLRSLEIAERLEERVGLPVLTSNMVSLWAALDHLYYADKDVPANKLFQLSTRSRKAVAHA
jgi:maleate isomerase